MEGDRQQWMLLYILHYETDMMLSHGELSPEEDHSTWEHVVHFQWWRSQVIDSLWHEGWGTAGVNSGHVYWAWEEMFNVMLKKSSWPLTFPTALGAGGALLYLQWETFSEVKGCSAQHTRRTMHTKDVFGDWACRKSYELMNNIKWRQNPNEDLNTFLGEPVTAKNWKYYWEKAVGSNGTLRNSGNSLRISVYKLGFLVGKGYLYSGRPQFTFYIPRPLPNWLVFNFKYFYLS